METNVTELPDSRVRVEVEVDPADVDARVKETAKRLGGEMKVPGFRKGKVPPEMVEQRLGRQAVLTEALEGSLAGWYEQGMIDAGVSPVGDPKLDLTELPDQGDPLRFAIEVAVRPKATLGTYKGLEVGRAEPEVPAEAVQNELERLREGFAKLNPVDRAAAEGDVLLIDYQGEIDGEPFEGGSAKDYLLELGAGRVLPELEKAVVGAKAGQEKEVDVTFPEVDERARDSATREGMEELAGKQATFKISVSEVREKELPELDDDFAAEASEFETIGELREAIADRMRELLDRQVSERFREAALDAAVAEATVEIPEEIVNARAEEMWQRVERQLAQQGMDSGSYLQMQGKSRDEVIAEARPDASRALKREAVLEAVAEAEGIEVGEEEMLEALTPPPGHEDHGHPEPAKALAELRKSGRDELLREDLRMRRALDLIASEAKPIPLEQAEAREQIWTPESEREEKGQLWTPGSE